MSQCCLVLTQWKFFISEPDEVHHRSRVTTDSTSWDYPACTRDTLWRQHYVKTGKEYLTNCHILLQYFELVFLQLQPVQIFCRLKLIIIWVNYEKKQKGVFLWNTSCTSELLLVNSDSFDSVRRTDDSNFGHHLSVRRTHSSTELFCWCSTLTSYSLVT